MEPVNADAVGRWRLWLAILVAGALGVLLLRVDTGWIVTQQARRVFLPPSDIKSLFVSYAASEDVPIPPEPGEAEAVERAARRQPNDYRVQLTAALGNYGSAHVTDRLRALVPGFAVHASLYAHIIRYACKEQVALHRPDEYALSSPPTGKEASDRPTPTPAQLAAFDRDAAAGERLDPENGYFPLIRALGLFGLHRDRDAIAAIERASMKPRMEDYTTEELDSRWYVDHEVLGKHGASQRLLLWMQTMCPQYARLRSVARVAIAQAAQAEQVGHIGEGIAIRQAIRRCGGRMRAQSHSMIGALVGVAIAAIATASPRNVQLGKRPATVTTEQWARKRLNAYVAFLTRTGHPDEARAVAEDFTAGILVKDVTRRSSQVDLTGGGPMFRLLALWILNGALLANAVSLLVLGGALALCVRRRTSRVASTTAIALCVLAIAMVAYSAWGWTDALAPGMDAASKADDQALPPFTSVLLGLVAAVPYTCGLTVVVPVIILFGAAIRFRPIAASTARGTLTASLALLLLYSGSAVATGSAERRLNATLAKVEYREGPYFAHILGSRWPVTVP